MFIFKGIRTIKDTNGEKNIKILAYTDSSKELLQKLFSNYSIIILSFSETDFGVVEGKKYEVSIPYENENIMIYFVLEGEKPNIKQAFSYFMDTFGIFDLNYIKPYGVELSEEKKKIVLNKLFEEYSKKNEKIKEIINEKDKTEQQGYIDDKKINEFKKDIEDFVEDAKDLIKNSQDVDPALNYDLQNILNELQKYKKISNIHKLAEIYKRALEVYEQLSDKYYNYLKQKEINSSKDNIISEIDIVSEYKKYQKVQRAKKLESIDAKEFGFPIYEVIFYKIFGKFGVNLKLIIKEFVQKYKLDLDLYSNILLFFQFLFIFLIIDYSFILLYNKFITNDNAAVLSSFYFILNFAIYGFIVTLGKLFAKKSLILSFIIIILFLIIFYFLKSYFTL